MTTPYSPACQRCGHPKARHANGTGKCMCRNSKIDPSLRGADGGCFCDKFLPGKTRAESIKIANRTMNAKFGRRG